MNFIYRVLGMNPKVILSILSKLFDHRFCKYDSHCAHMHQIYFKFRFFFWRGVKHFLGFAFHPSATSLLSWVCFVNNVNLNYNFRALT